MATTVTTWNKGQAPAGSTGWNLTPDIRSGLESLNVVVPVGSQSERDAITPPNGKYVGMAVTRADLGGLVEVWNGTSWLSPVKRRHAEFTGTADTTANSQWGLSVLTQDNALTFNNTFASAGAASRIVLSEPGDYSIQIIMQSSTSPGVWYASIKNSANTYVYGDNTNGTGSVWGVTATVPSLVTTAPNTEILFGLTTGNSIHVTARVIIRKAAD